jgi:hypothetical protein
MDHFGLKSVKDLPKLKDLHIADNEIGTPADLMDTMDIPVDLAPGTESIENDLRTYIESPSNSETENLAQDLQTGEIDIDPNAQ